MAHSVRRLTAAAAMATLPMAGVVVFTPAISSACLPGETAGPTACAPFCLPGKALDVFASTGAVGLEASEWWGASQAALSVAIWSWTSCCVACS